MRQFMSLCLGLWILQLISYPQALSSLPPSSSYQPCLSSTAPMSQDLLSSISPPSTHTISITRGSVGLMHFYKTKKDGGAITKTSKYLEEKHKYKYWVADAIILIIFFHLCYSSRLIKDFLIISYLFKGLFSVFLIYRGLS
ncbi:hypothetical protein KP509_27G055500 [Ceratopteris richardii]|uniref:Uncharacterized protein n=1 Tax=Ceratopteris richardii TaxID=49495 RepID=A0A8T2RI21_CERRI|nr:hypothetical protein KP509_27G055500 [Ceratopteris richardii]